MAFAAVKQQSPAKAARLMPQNTDQAELNRQETVLSLQQRRD
ncbi:hypothetical protein [Acidisoma silvae]|nr:hypothetical protein [Acidisoma silvae]